MASVDPISDREALRRLLAAKAFVTAGDGRVLRDQSGAAVPWLYYGGEVSLTAQGARLMASVMLERLATFEAVQIATYGLSAIPPMTTCVMLSGGRYSGLIVRKQAKEHGFIRQIDGPVDPSRPVVLVDDSVSSGNSLREAVCALEGAGLRVEGAVCLVEFSGYGAREWFTARGYRLETIYDVWRDLGREGAPAAPHPTAPASWAADRLPPGLSPAVAARCVAEHLLRSGRVLRAPASLDRRYGEAGTFVSIRRRADDVRLARAGTRHSAAPADLHPGVSADPLTDLVIAAAQATLAAGLQEVNDLAAVKFAVSFLGPAEAITPGQIDYQHHALAVRGFGPLDRTGFALPNSPHYDDEISQYQYARTISGRFWKLEPHALFQQSVERVCEPGADWPPYGAPPAASSWADSTEFAHELAVFVQEILNEQLGRPGRDGPVPVPVAGGPFSGAGVCLYASGLAGCAISLAGDLSEALREATKAALDDSRYGRSIRSRSADDVTAVVSLLLHKRPLGRLTADRLTLFYRLGRDSLHAADGARNGIVLAHFAAQQSLTQQGYQDQVLLKAGLTAETAQWTAYETVSWVAAPGWGQRMELGYPARAEPAHADTDRLLSLAQRIAGYICGQRSADGLPASAWAPWTNRSAAAGTATRVLIAITGLLEAAPLLGDEVLAAACAMVGLFIEGDQVRVPRPSLRWDSGADAQLLTCLLLSGLHEQHPALAATLVQRLRGLMHPDGVIHAGTVRMSADLDLLSGSVVAALAKADAAIPGTLDGIDLAAIFSFYRERFRRAAPWGMVWWHGQAWSALAARDGEFGNFAFELTEWALARQSTTNGAFVIHDMPPARSSFLTACVLEAVADSWRWARLIGDHDRSARYERSWRHGADFVDLLTLRVSDAYFSAFPAACAGGVRATLPSSELRIDYAGHALIALAKGMRAQDTEQSRK